VSDTQLAIVIAFYVASIVLMCYGAAIQVIARYINRPTPDTEEDDWARHYELAHRAGMILAGYLAIVIGIAIFLLTSIFRFLGV
jgi:hypothetical protein